MASDRDPASGRPSRRLSPSPPFRAAVVGLGHFGASFRRTTPDPLVGELLGFQHVESYAQVSRTSLAAVCDLDPAARSTFSSEWGARFPDVNSYASHADMLASEELDILSVAVSDDRHTQVVLDAIAAGVKGILCEKPLTTSLPEADQIIAACEDSGTYLLVNHTRRWHPEFHEARRIIRSGDIGRLVRITTTWEGPRRSMLFRNGAHAIDGIAFFAESQPEWVIAELDDEFAGYGAAYRGQGGKVPDSDPGGHAFIRCQNGVRVFLSMSKHAIANIEHDLVCERGRIRIGNGCAELWLHQEVDDLMVRPFPLFRLRTTRGNTAGALEELCDLLERGGTPSCGPREGRQAVEVMFAILQSSAAGSAKVHFPIKY